ncbi:MAG: hypothetical protein WC969_10685 [Elusimicrobiota bacterium]|jgi:hypothetical protein
MLLETVLAILIMTTVTVALVALVQKSMIVSFKAREQMTCTRMVQSGFSRLKNIDFYYLFASDSNNANHGLWAAYPYKGVLDGLKSTLLASKFDRFRVQTTFMRRDTSDANGNGLTSDLIAFTDANGNNIDDYDSNIRFLDQNGDGDLYDTYASGGRTVAEQPDTHIKKVQLDVFRRGRWVCGHTEYISLEQFSGDSNPSSEAVLNLLVSTPSNNATVYRQATAAQTNALGLSIAKSYPSDLVRYRADASAPLLIAGETEPLANVNLYVGASGILATLAADGAGAFSGAPALVTSNLAEGSNLLTAQSAKDAYTSPVAPRTLLYDYGLPTLTSPTPSGTVNTKSPYVSIVLRDVGLATSTVSGICLDVITLKVNGAEVAYNYDATRGTITWVDAASRTSPILADGSYTVLAEGGDYAGYKTTHSWTFSVAVPVTDNSAPAVANKVPSGMASSQLPVISVRVFDNQSGIVPSSIRLSLDGAVVVDSSNLEDAYDPASDTVSYTPSSPFAPGSAHTVEVSVDHWATDPLDKVNHTESWSFNVPW